MSAFRWGMFVAQIVLSGGVAYLTFRTRRIVRGYRRNAANHQDRTAPGAGNGASEGTTSTTGTGGTGIAIWGSSARAGEDAEPFVEPGEEQVYVAPVWGFRTWGLEGETIPKLASLNAGGHPEYGTTYYWRPGKNTAVCNKMRYESSVGMYPMYRHDPCGATPGARCSCGFYALREAFHTYDGTLGGVVGWGRVVDGDLGWRAEFAAVSALFLPPWAGDEYRQKVVFAAHVYGVPVCSTLEELAERTQSMAEWMAGNDLLEESTG